MKWRRAHTDCLETTTNAIFNIKNEPPFCYILMANRKKFITAIRPGQEDSTCASGVLQPQPFFRKIYIPLSA
jgi:hypothetical protein